jgi:signal transduction histidine kinase
VAPYEGNVPAFGFDLASHPVRLKFLHESRDTGKSIATDKIYLVQEQHQNVGVLVFSPFYGVGDVPKTLAERREKLKGFILGVYRVEDMINKMIISRLKEGMSLTIYQGDDTDAKNKLFGGLIENPPLQVRQQIEFFGRLWTILWQGSFDFNKDLKDNYAVWASAGVLVLFIFIATIFEMNASRTWQVEKEVDLRTLELRESNKNLGLAKNDAEQASRAKTVFLSSMSHELRTPLNAILGFSQLLELEASGTLTAVQKENVSHILNAGRHLLELVSEILDVSSIEAGKITLVQEAVLISPVIKEMLSYAQPVAEQSGIRLIDKTTEFSAYHILADRTRFKQIMINLASNAIKYNNPEGSVTFMIQKINDSRLRFCVKDTGRGIASALRPHVFEPFNRLGAEAMQVEGVGLGLSISKKLVELMGGSIGFESLLNEGSLFYIELPIANTSIEKGESI